MTDDVNQPCGWYFAVVTPGHPPLRRHKVYELDQARARELVRHYAQLYLAETCEPIKQLNIRELAADNLRPGEVKPQR